MDNINNSKHSADDSRSGGLKKRASVRESMSGAFRKARMSFVRSRGDRGAAVETLRGTTGADFESQGMIHRGVEGGCCGGWFLGSDPMADRYIVVKGPFCFVFVKEHSSSPQYAIKLHGMVAELKDQHHHHGRSLILLRNGALGEVQYEISFPQEDIAKKFKTAVAEQAQVAATEETRKRLGHERLLTTRSSVRYAETIAITKEKDQPEKPVSRDDVLRNMEQMDIAGGPAI